MRYVIDRLVQYNIPYSLFVVIRVGNVGLLYHTAKDVRNGIQEVLPYMTFKETLFQCNSCLLSFLFRPSSHSLLCACKDCYVVL